MDIKQCTMCGEEKPISDFLKEKRVRGGLGTRCFTCRSAKAKEWRQKNKDRIKKHYEENRSSILAKQKEYYEKNKDAIAEKNREYRSKNGEKRSAQRKAWIANMTAEERVEYLEKKKQWWASMSEEKKAIRLKKSSQRYFENKEHHLKKCKEWAERNREKSNGYKKAYAERNPEKTKRQQNEYHKKNREEINARGRRRRVENREELNARAMARYYKNHEVEVLKRREWRKKNQGRLTDGYVRSLLTDTRTFGITNPPQELIELKRVQLNIHRELNRGATK